MQRLEIISLEFCHEFDITFKVRSSVLIEIFLGGKMSNFGEKRSFELVNSPWIQYAIVQAWPQLGRIANNYS